MRVVAIAAAIWASTAFAANAGEAPAVTSVRVDRGSIEVLHRLPAVEAEKAMRSVFGVSARLNETEGALEAVGEYVSGRFRLTTPFGLAIDLAVDGVDRDGDDIWVYQSGAAPEGLTGLSIGNRILRDVSAAPCEVTVERAGAVTKLVFDDESQLSVTF
ncbi:MAG: DUF6702 family protein [Pseudomonadota bacterium]